MLRRWEELPEYMKTPEVRPYWESLWQKRGQLCIKRGFDIAFALVLLVIVTLPMVIIALMIKADDGGPVFYRQERVTAYGKRFYIHKFRTMVVDADKTGTAVTVGRDPRITGIGAKLRKYRLDELPQLFDVLSGDMSFVGTRPEVVKYVEMYKPEYNATLLMPAGITSECSIRYKDEDELLYGAEDVDRAYVENVLPAKMIWNLKYVKNISFFHDIAIMVFTVITMVVEITRKTLN